MSNNQSSSPLNLRVTYYIPQELDVRMEQIALDLRLTHGVKVSKSELVRTGVELLLSLGPSKIYETLS